MFSLRAWGMGGWFGEIHRILYDVYNDIARDKLNKRMSKTLFAAVRRNRYRRTTRQQRLGAEQARHCR
ncbi:MAG TPA: hypothetical protein VFH31_03300 [Pyrinomonadaceae bacterium]|nr:hypothetical protein [Pyrinomonadaceae bacterium]